MTGILGSHEPPENLQENVRREVERATACCVICLGDVVEQCEAQPCQHNDFDFFCLATWLEERATCPLCKRDVSEVRYNLGGNKEQVLVYKVPKFPRGNGSNGDDNCLDRGSRAPQFEEAIQRRRLIYQHKAYSLRVGSNAGQPAGSKYRELSPEQFVTDPELVSRARMWLHRELQVFDFLEEHESRPSDRLETATQHGRHAHRDKPSKAVFLREYIIAILKSMDMQGSTGQAEELIQEHLGRDNTRLLLHELRAWLRSPCKSLREWDAIVQYAGGSGIL